MTQKEIIGKFQTIEDNFIKALVSNDVTEIKKCITPDWVLIDSQGGIIPQERLLSVL